jgi:hypothetical protein
MELWVPKSCRIPLTRMQLTVKKRGNNPIHPVEEIPDRPYAGKRASPH